MTRFEALLATGVFGLGIAVVAVVGRGESASDARAKAERDAHRIRSAAERWREEHVAERGCPTLTQLIHDDALDREAETDDPWGERYRVDCKGEAVRVSSPGEDRKPGTADDIDT